MDIPTNLEALKGDQNLNSQKFNLRRAFNINNFLKYIDKEIAKPAEGTKNYKEQRTNRAKVNYIIGSTIQDKSV